MYQTFKERDNDMSRVIPRFGAYSTGKCGFQPRIRGSLNRTSEMERFSIYLVAADGNWENCVRSQGAYFEGD